MKKVFVAPSILSADFAKMGEEVRSMEKNGADMIHYDVMDGVFVNNITFGMKMVEDIRKLTKLPLDCHLMIVQPEKFIKEIKELGTMMMNVHYETCTHLHRVVQQIKDAGMKAGVTLNPATPVVMLKDIITELDMVLLMSVNPGFGGQKFIPQTLNKLKELRELINETGSHALIEVDGGVNLETGKLLVEGGADALVAGNAVFKAPDMVQMISQLKNL